VVKESLRRLCIWKNYGEQDGVGEIWWNYIGEFMERCNSPDYFMNEDCVNDCYKHSGVDSDKINTCMRDSGGLTNDSANALLDLEINAQNERGVVVLPTAFVNTAAMRGQLSSGTVFHAICAGYAEGTRPDVCDKCSSCADAPGCVATGFCSAASPSSSSSKSVSTHTFASSMLFMMFVFGGVGIWHYKKTREDMREQVRGILAEYMPLEDQEMDGTSPMDFARRGAATSLIS